MQHGKRRCSCGLLTITTERCQADHPIFGGRLGKSDFFDGYSINPIDGSGIFLALTPVNTVVKTSITKTKMAMTVKIWKGFFRVTKMKFRMRTISPALCPNSSVFRV
jgi:hypothetical protein